MSEFRELLEPIADLLQRKNNDYGNSYDKLRDEYGPLAYLVRVKDKLNRFETLLTETLVDEEVDLQVTEESIIDTLNDIIGYTTLEKRYQQKDRLAKEVNDGN